MQVVSSPPSSAQADGDAGRVYTHTHTPLKHIHASGIARGAAAYMAHQIYSSRGVNIEATSLITLPEDNNRPKMCRRKEKLEGEGKMTGCKTRWSRRKCGGVDEWNGDGELGGGEKGMDGEQEEERRGAGERMQHHEPSRHVLHVNISRSASTKITSPRVYAWLCVCVCVLV